MRPLKEPYSTCLAFCMPEKKQVLVLGPLVPFQVPDVSLSSWKARFAATVVNGPCLNTAKS